MIQDWKGWRLSEFKQNNSSWIRHDSTTDTNYIYINIPKNASSWMRQNFGGWFYNFRSNTFFQQDVLAAAKSPILHASNPPVYVIILRDPISRWLSGSAQAFFSCSPSSPDFFMNYSDDLLFNTVVFDEHTAPQTIFLKDVDLSRVVWFDCTDNLINQVIEWSQDKFNISPRPSEDYEENVYKISKLNKPQRLDVDPSNWTTMQCIDALKHKLFSRPEYMQKLIEVYKDDYALRESVEFYGTR